MMKKIVSAVALSSCLCVPSVQAGIPVLCENCSTEMTTNMQLIKDIQQVIELVEQTKQAIQQTEMQIKNLDRLLKNYISDSTLQEFQLPRNVESVSYGSV